jgi:hypothetical protein
VFFEEPVFEVQAGVTLRLVPQKSGVVVALPVFPIEYPHERVEQQLRELVDEVVSRYRYRGSALVVWYYTPMALGFSDHLQAELCVYDCMDELSAFRGAPVELGNREQKLFAKTHIVFCGGASLFEAKCRQHHSVYAFPSSVDRRHFAMAKAGSREDPADQRHIAHPRIGFFGVIDERMDLQLIEQLADLRPDLQLVLLGPVVKIDPESVPRRPNIHSLGAKSYDELPSYLGGWDAGFMPFAINESTRFISPTKTPEFLSAGLPLVSTPVSDVVKPYGVEGLVSIASTAEEMGAALDECLAGREAQWQALVDRKLATMSWDKTWAAMDNIISGRLQRRPRMPKATVIAGEAQSYV